MRELVSVRKIKEIKPIKGADRIELAIIDGWQVVVEKGRYEIDQRVVYFEIDSHLPMNEYFNFLEKHGTKKMKDGKPGHVLKTVRLRGCVSQGLILPLPAQHIMSLDNLKEFFGVELYEPPIPFEMSKIGALPFPSFLRKTDEERIQNQPELFEKYRDETILFTEKLDGTSFTAFIKDGEFGVCGRNYRFDLINGEDNTFTKTARELRIEEKLRGNGGNYCIQGELIGEGIQNNKYKINGHDIRFFTVFDIDKQQKLGACDCLEFIKSLGLGCVPVVGTRKMSELDIPSVLELARGFSMLNPETVREGIVGRSQNEKNLSFKVINNDFLLQE